MPILATINTLTGFPIVEEGSVRLAPLAALRDIAVRHGLPLAERLADPESTATFAEVGHFLNAMAAATATEHVSLVASSSATLDSMGPIGGIARGARDVGAALRGLILALHLHDRVTVATLETANGRATLGTVALGLSQVEGAAHVADLTMVACFNILRELCGPDWRAQEVYLARRAPRDPRPWSAHFRVSPTFDAERNALVFDAAWLGRPVAPGRAPAGAASFESVVLRHPLDPPARVRRLCVRAIIEGTPTVDRVAALCATSRRTLNRHLATAGTTAQAELIAVKLAIAKQLLEGTGLSMTEITHLLGYTDGSAFTRAFRAVEGVAPSRWRAMQARPPRLARPEVL
ncbi:MAG: AraC family transcriptional regulator [Proteobacteria bacterium]|nr:AraC family transcriptional regulator [Pseudomonadota bacterium]